jgi:large subunit ribosomal protein L32
MPLPKRRHSRARQAKRRTHYKLELPAMYLDSRTGEYKPLHRVDPLSGQYKGRQVVEPKRAKPEEKA